MIKIGTMTPNLAQELCGNITADLAECFGFPETNKHYTKGVRSGLNLAENAARKYVSLLSINFPYPENASIYWMGILKNFHRQGVGK